MPSTERVIDLTPSAWQAIGSGNFVATADEDVDFCRVTSRDDATLPTAGSVKGSPLQEGEVLRSDVANGLTWFAIGRGTLIVQDGA